MTTNIYLNRDEVKSWSTTSTGEWHGYKASQESVGIDPLILNTHDMDPFYGNQGVLSFECTADQLRGALEHYQTTDSVSHECLHFMVKGRNWDYARTMSNVSWKKFHDDWGLVDSDPDKIWITDKSQIQDEKKYFVTCHGGWGYVFIHEVTD